MREKWTFLFLHILFLNPIAIALAPHRPLACDITQIKNPPKVVLIGEQHRHTSSESIKQSLIGQASRGQIPVMSEPLHYDGGFLPWDKNKVAELFSGGDSPHLHGMISPIPYGLIASYYLQESLIRNEVDKRVIARNLFHHIHTNPLIRLAFERAKKKFAQGTTRFAVNEYVRRVESSLQEWASVSKMPHETRARYKTKVGNDFSNETLSEFVTEVHRQTIAIANEKYSERIMGQTLIPLLSLVDGEAIGLVNGRMRENSMFYKIVVDVRDRDYAHDIADKLCHYESQSSHLFVVIGRGHQPGVKRWLDGLSNGQIEIIEFDSSEHGSSSLIRDALKEHQWLSPGEDLSPDNKDQGSV